MIKNLNSDARFATLTKSETFGGIDINLQPGYEMYELLNWWQEWKQVMKNMHPSVQEALQQAKVLHELTKNNDQSKSWMQTSV